MPTLLFITNPIFLTTSLAVVDRVTSPSDVASVGAPKFTISVSPVGMAVSILAVILFFIKIDITVIEYVVELSVAGTGMAPAVAVFMVRVTGAKSLSSFISAMKYVTV